MTGSHWVHLTEYSGLGEADLATGILEGAEIPVLVKGPPAGIFGPGFAGATASGVTLMVPEEYLTPAREALGLE